MEQKREELLSHLQAAHSLAKELRADIKNDSVLQARLTGISRALLRQVEPPGERVWEIYSQLSIVPLIRVALDAGWLDDLAIASDTGVTAIEVASPRGADPSLVGRTLRCLAREFFVDEVGPSRYAPNEMTKLLAAPGIRDGFIHFSNSAAAFSCLPSYFSKNQYQNPPDIENGPYAYGLGAPMWKDLIDHPDKQKAFDKFMGAVRHSKKDWYYTFPVEQLQVGSEDDILLVDVGGGLGHDLVGFDAHRKSVKLPGRLVLQDRAIVTEKVPEDRRQQVEVLSQDFFTPQPQSCLHAKAFYMRMILHDWTDAACLTILGHLCDAMKPGYSRLLINDQVLPEKDCPRHEAFFDVIMMAMVSGKQRTKQEWHELVEQVKGLKIERIWALEEGVNFESVIEVVRET